jgi:transcriptional regulator GlxA family with amidase domain
VTLETTPISQFEGVEIDTIVIPGALEIEPTLADRRLVDWLAAHAPMARRTASVCAGAFLLAEAGLLDGRRAVTHWASCDALHHRYAMQVARQLVIYVKRPGGQSQFSELLKTQTLTSTAFEDLHLWISKNLGDERLNVDQLAERVGMSPRNFARSYKAKTGRTPAKAIEVFRLEAARRLLEETEQGVDRIARNCGFRDEERMRTTFRRHLAISPRDYRRRFSTHSSTARSNEPQKS